MAQPMRKRLAPMHASDRWRDRRTRGKPLRLLTRERAARVAAAIAKRAGPKVPVPAPRLPAGGGVVSDFVATARAMLRDKH
jgi:hypothetical protein